MTTGIRPTRDTLFPPLLPDLAEDLAAHTQLAGTLTGHDTLGSGQDGNTDARKHPGDILLLGIDTATRAADTFQTGDNRLALTSLTDVLDLQAQDLLAGVSPSATSKFSR